MISKLSRSKRFAIRSKLPNCVPFQAGEFGVPSDCVAQCEAIYALEKGEIGIASGTIGRLDATRLRDVIKAIGEVIDSDCEPNGACSGRMRTAGLVLHPLRQPICRFNPEQ